MDMVAWISTLNSEQLRILDRFSSIFTTKEEWDLIAEYIAK